MARFTSMASVSLLWNTNGCRDVILKRSIEYFAQVKVVLKIDVGNRHFDDRIRSHLESQVKICLSVVINLVH